MIKPTRYMNLNLSLIRVSSEIIELLIKSPIMKFDEILASLEQIIGNEVRFVFIPAIDFLYLLGIIDYHEELDVFELVSDKVMTGS